VNIFIRSLAFGVMTGIYSIAVTYSTVGFPIATVEDQLRVAALFTVSAIGGIYAYRRDPEAVWKIGPATPKP
jgi:4-hydroxybenzoate polyprenyltransferase